jgi:hypothetical protein
MAISILTDAMVIINGVTLSDHANEVTITDTRDKKDVTAFGATNYAYAKGLGDGSIDIKMFQDFAGGKTYATLQPLISSTSTVVIEIRPTSGARSATNPAVLMSGLMVNFNFVMGKVGEPSMTDASFVNGAAAGITYVTS